MRIRRSACVAFLTTALAAIAAAQEPAPALGEVLARAGKYVESYERDFADVVAEETYTQDAAAGSHFDLYGHLGRTGVKHRELKSDLLLVRPDGASHWLQFRDVFEVDHHIVRDRTNRLAKLFLQPSSSLSTQLSKITSESARYNIGSVVRNVNVPVLALSVLIEANQARFQFGRDESPGSGAPPEVWTVTYREVAPGTMIRTLDHRDLPVQGQFWIEPATGRVLVTRLRAANETVRARIDVNYAPDAALGLLVPREMTESYVQPLRDATVEGRATYSNFRRFQVKVDERIVPIK